MDMKLHHIGFVVENIEQSVEIFELIGLKKSGEKVEDLNQNNFLQMMEDSNGNRIELIEPIDENSTVNKYNKGLHHLAFTTNNEEELLKTIKANRLGKIFTKDIPAPLFNNKNVSFGYLKNDLLIEIVSK